MTWVTTTVVVPVMNVGIVGMYELHQGHKPLARVPKGTYERNTYRHHDEKHYEVKECGYKECGVHLAHQVCARC